MNKILPSLVLPMLLLAGCGESQQSELQKQFLLKSAPASTSTIKEIRKMLQADDGPKEVSVAVGGRVYAGKENEPWEPGKAAFFITDFSGHDGKSEHNPFDCSYCADRIEDYRSFVTFSDADGVIEIDSRELFDVKEKQFVLMQGTATLAPSGEEVMISGTGIYIPQK